MGLSGHASSHAWSIELPAGTPVQVRLPDEEREALDTYRREQRDPPSRAQALRDLARRALNERERSYVADAPGAEIGSCGMSIDHKAEPETCTNARPRH